MEHICVAFGKGSKPFVIIPGLSLNRIKGAGLSLAYMYRIFTKDYRVYVFDKKDVIPEGYTIKKIAEDTANAMKELGIEKAYVLGVSQGGMVAQYLANSKSSVDVSHSQSHLSVPR